ncbi:MAG: PspC domain-containing protein [Chloroflexota bacterium]
MTERLYRSRDDRMLAGVAGGLAETLDVDPSIIRVVWAVLVFLTGGLALLVYIVMAVVVPERPAGQEVWHPGGAAAGGPTVPTEPVADGGWRAPDGTVVPRAGTASTSPRRARGAGDGARGGLIVGLILILIGAFSLVRQLAPAFDLALWWPIVAIGLGILVIVLALLPSRGSS